MAVTDIKLVRKWATVPDFGRNLTIMYREKNFPLTDESGNVIYTSALDANGNLIPEYYDFTVNVQLPNTIPSTVLLRQAMLDDLKLQADTQAKIMAQQRANDIIDKNKIRTIVKTLNDDTGVVFEGTVDLSGINL